MHDGDNPQEFFIRCVGYQIVPDSNEAQRPGGKVWACVASIGNAIRPRMAAWISSRRYAQCASPHRSHPPLTECRAAAGIASAYNAPIAGSFFVAEIVLGTIVVESLGPLSSALWWRRSWLNSYTAAARFISPPGLPCTAIGSSSFFRWSACSQVC